MSQNIIFQKGVQRFKDIDLKRGTYDFYFKNVDLGKINLKKLPQEFKIDDPAKKLKGTVVSGKIDKLIFPPVIVSMPPTFNPTVLHKGRCDCRLRIKIENDNIAVVITALIIKAIIVIAVGVGLYLSLNKVEKIIKVGGGVPVSLAGLGIGAVVLWQATK